MIHNSAVQRRLRARLSDAQSLIGFHGELTGDEPGRRYAVDALNRGSIVLSVAAWDAFIEDLARANSLVLARRLKGPKRLPDGCRDAFLNWMIAIQDLSKPTKEAKRTIWSMTGPGWRLKFAEYSRIKSQSYGTPNAKRIRKLFKDSLGLEDITSSWGHRRWGPDTYCEKLDQLLDLRHRIAHGTIDNETVGKTKAREAERLISNLAARSVIATERHLKQLNLLAPRKAKSIEID